jgi:tetratricopeptide (TPR) repeat protein
MGKEDPLVEIVAGFTMLKPKGNTKMPASPYIWLAVALVVLYLVWRRTGKGVVAKALRMNRTIKAIMSAYRRGDYATGLEKTESLKDGTAETAEYCMFRGLMLHQLGRLNEAEACLREALPLHDEARQRALILNSLASVLMDQERCAEAIAFYENAGGVWPDRGASLRGIAEVWLHQGREPNEALEQARQAVQIDRHATGMSKETLASRLGEDLAVLAWALAVNSHDPTEVESALTEAFQLCGNKSASVSAQIHYHAGRAYVALHVSDKSREHLQRAAEIDPQGRFGRMARSTFPQLGM